MNRSRLQILLYALGFLATIAFFVFAVYWLFFRQPPTGINGNENGNVNGIVNGLPNTNGANANVNGGVNQNGNIALPNVNAGNLPDKIARGGNTETRRLTDDSILEPRLADNGIDLLYYDSADGHFYRRSADGRTQTVLTDETFPEVRSIAWSSSGNKAVMTFPDGTNLFYDFDKKTKATLPRELKDASFSPQGDKLASKFLGGDNADNWLTVSNPDGSGAQAIEPLGENADQVDVNWSPNQQVVATYHHATSFSTEEVIFLGANGENFPAVNIPGQGFEGIWSKDGRQMLYSAYSEDTRNVPQLYFMNASGDSFGTNHQGLSLETWADKCTFSMAGTSVYCAVPNFLPSGSGMERGLAAGTPDEIYRIDLVNGKAERIARPVDQGNLWTITANTLLVSPTEDVLYFTNANDGRAYSMQLR